MDAVAATPAAAAPVVAAPVMAMPMMAMPVMAMPAPAKSNVKYFVLILFLLIIAAAAGIAGYLYLPELIREKIEPHTPTEVFMPTTATVSANTTSLYKEKSAKSTVLKTLKKNEVVVVTGLPANGWAPVKSGSIPGWVLSNSITVKK
jgi:recombinational DNA repair protein RecR